MLGCSAGLLGRRVGLGQLAHGRAGRQGGQRLQRAGDRPLPGFASLLQRGASLACCKRRSVDEAGVACPGRRSVEALARDLLLGRGCMREFAELRLRSSYDSLMSVSRKSLLTPCEAPRGSPPAPMDQRGLLPALYSC